MSDEIRKIALEFFKDKFGVLYEKQKELIVKIEALENHIKSMVETDTSNQDRIIALEKKFEDAVGSDSVWMGNTMEEIKDLVEQIAELRENTNIWVQNYNRDLNELKEEIGLHDRLLSHYKKHIGKNREVLRELIKEEQIFREDEGYGKIEVLTKLLEKLDSPKKTEKKEVCECGHSVLVHDPVSCRYCDCLIYTKDSGG